jgi:F-box and leucine-rich repeat protein GRR1
MSILVGFPTDVKRYFLTNWLTMNDLCRLDSTICNNTYRNEFLNDLNNSVVNGIIAFNTQIQLYFKWIFARNLFPMKLSLTCDIADEDLVAMLKNCSKVESFTLLHNSVINNSPFNCLELAKACINLKILHIISGLITNDGLMELTSRCKNLEDIDVNYSHFSYNKAIAISQCLNLKYLNLCCCIGLTDGCLILIAKNCRKLKKLDIKNCPELTDLSLTEIARNCTALETIDIDWCYFTDLSIKEIATHCLNLKELSFNENKSVTVASLFLIAKKCLKLESVNTYPFFETIVDEDLVQLSRHCSNLKKLELNSFLITDVGLVAMIKNCRKIEEIIIYECEDLTDESLFEISNYCPNLKSLTLQDCEKFTDEGLIYVKKFCQKLTCLNVSRCINITQRSVK